MTELQPDAGLAELLNRYDQSGGVVEHILMSADCPSTPEYERHRLAALTTLRTLGRRLDAYFDTPLSRSEYRSRRREDFFQIAINEEMLTGTRITLKEFLGPRFDLNTNRFQSGDRTGYAYAFSDPPHGIDGGLDAAEGMFRGLTDRLFHGFRELLIIYSWSPDCSNYFDAGREWWGTFFWTVRVDSSDVIVGIAASSTD